MTRRGERPDAGGELLRVISDALQATAARVVDDALHELEVDELTTAWRDELTGQGLTFLPDDLWEKMNVLQEVDDNQRRVELMREDDTNKNLLGRATQARVGLDERLFASERARLGAESRAKNAPGSCPSTLRSAAVD
jgi:hypothetical protein